MNNFTYEAPTRIYFGKKQECNVGEYIRPYGKKVMLIHYGDPFIRTTGLYDRIIDSLKGAGLEVVELTGIVPNPRATKVREGIEICRKEHVDFLLPVGGGSVIDTAKAIAAGYGYEGDFWDMFVGKGAPGKEVLPIGVILTIAATGSESNCAAVITNDEASAKLGYGNPCMYPKFAIMNPELTTTLPPRQTAAACVDVIAHVLEDYIHDNFNVQLNDRFCESIMKTVVEVAPVLMKDPANYDARAELMWASNNACKGFLAVGDIDATSHILEHELSAKYDVTHGVGLAVLQPAWLRHIYLSCVPRFAKFAVNVWGCEYNFGHPERTALEGIERMEEFFRSLNMPTHLSELNIDGSRIEEMAHNCFNRYGAITSCKEFTVEDYIEIFRLAL